jgi:hypothetical protein
VPAISIGGALRRCVRSGCEVPGRLLGRLHTEHWIPAEELAELNRNIVGLIEVIASFEQH